MIDSIFQMINEENCCRKKARFLCFVFFGINNERWRERERVEKNLHDAK